MSCDITFDLGTFSSTEATVTANTDAGRALLAEICGTGAVSCTMRKSRGEDFLRFAKQRGLSVAPA